MSSGDVLGRVHAYNAQSGLATVMLDGTHGAMVTFHAGGFFSGRESRLPIAGDRVKLRIRNGAVVLARLMADHCWWDRGRLNVRCVRIPVREIYTEVEDHQNHMSREVFDTLKASIQQDGLLHPVVILVGCPSGAEDRYKYTVFSGRYRVKALADLRADWTWSIVCLSEMEANAARLWEHYDESR